MQTQMAVTRRNWCDFVSFDPRMPARSQLLIVRIERDPHFVRDIEEKVAEFLNEVAVEVELMKGN